MKSLILLVLVVSTGCTLRFVSSGIEGSGVMVEETRVVEAFEGISLDGSGDIVVEIGGPASVTVEIDDNLLDIITTEVRDGRLLIDSRENYRSSRRLRVRITTPELNFIGLQGSGEIQIPDYDGNTLEVTLSGSGDVRGSGAAGQLKISINGSGDVDLSDLVAAEADVTISGSGDVRVHVLDKLSATIRGSGDISYRGSPTVNESVFGSGNISPYPFNDSTKK